MRNLLHTEKNDPSSWLNDSRVVAVELRKFNRPSLRQNTKGVYLMSFLRIPRKQRRIVSLLRCQSLCIIVMLNLICCVPMYSFTTPYAPLNDGRSFRRRNNERRRRHQQAWYDFPSLSLTEAPEIPPLSSLNVDTRKKLTKKGATDHRATSILKPVTSSNFYYSSSPPSLQGLSKFHLSILSRTTKRQRLMTGRYPVIVTVKDNPTRKWLNHGRRGTIVAETEVFVNGTSPSRSLASLDRFLWLDDAERRWQQEKYAMVSLELLAVIHLERPGYLQILDANGAGAGADAAETDKADTVWSLRAMQLFKQRIESQQRVLSSSIDMDHCCYPMNKNKDRLWVTGFSLAGRQGLVTAVDCERSYIKSVNDQSKSAMLWPNEVQQVPVDILGPSCVVNKLQPRCINGVQNDDGNQRPYQDALLVCDGFLVPTKDRGGVYVVKNPGHETERTVCLTKSADGLMKNADDRWFYHRAVWADLTGDGRKSLLTARCKVSTGLGNSKNDHGFITSGITKRGELVWLECPKPASIDPKSGTPLESDGTVFNPFSSRHLPWKTRVLATGPDVMFCVADMDAEDDTIEVISSQFFKMRVTLHSIKQGLKPKVVLHRSIDEHCGRAFGSILASLDTKPNDNPNGRCVVDSGSTVECLAAGDSFSHLLVTSHECSYVAESSSVVDERAGARLNNLDTKDSEFEKANSGVASTTSTEGGSLFAYRVPDGKDAWKTESWKRTTVASGFKVNGKLNNMINPGAPGFVYTFHAKKDDAKLSKRPMIAVAGDCAESAYIFRPEISDNHGENAVDKSTNYELMAEIQCKATVGSIGIGYDNFSSTDQESGYAKLYIPCYEKDKILVFGIGSGEDDTMCW